MLSAYIWCVLCVYCVFAQRPIPELGPIHFPHERLPSRWANDPLNRVPDDNAIFFPQSEESDEEDRPFDGFRIRDFRIIDPRHIPKPRRPLPGPPPRPGEPFPPPPGGGARPPKRRPNGKRRLCETKYSEYVERIFPNDTAIAADANDADFDGRILARPGEYPHMAAVGFETGEQLVEYRCGGSLISENFVITAAHCTAVNNETPKWVRVGVLNLMEASKDTELFAIRQIHNHPNYDGKLYYNDIALLQLDRDVELTEFVRPIRLWTHKELPTSLAFAMGYGSTSFAKAMTNRLTNLNLTIVPTDECNTSLPALAEAPNGVLSSQLCAQDYLLHRDTCQGDSGGPLQLNLPGRRNRRNVHYHLIGITSYGVFCRSSYPSVYTRVSAFLDWIEQLTWNSTDS